MGNPKYDAAEARVLNTPELQPFRSIILGDWPEGDKHWEWVTTATVAEIVAWAEDVRDYGGGKE